MNHTGTRVLAFMTIMLFCITPLFSRPHHIAVGAQAGFSATGVLVDIGLGAVDLSAGLNYPIGYASIASLADIPIVDRLDRAASITADITTAFDMNADVSLKVGLSTIVLTDFSTGIGGTAGPCVKGTYRLPNQRMEYFVNLSIPVMLYGILASDFGNEGKGIYCNPWLPFTGLFSSTFGLIYNL